MRVTRRNIIGRGALAALLLCFALQARAASVPADDQPGDVVAAWSELLATTIKTAKLAPPPASRVIAYFGVTMHEAVAPGRRDGLSLAGQLNDLAGVPQPDLALDHDWRLVANAAAACYLSQQFAPSTPLVASIERLHHAQLKKLSEGVPHDVVLRSEAQGQAVANAVHQWSQRDGFTRLDACWWVPPKGPGAWEPTPLDLGRALQPCWGQMRPFVLATPAACLPPEPTPYSEDPGSQFMREAREVRDAVDGQTPEDRALALFWSDDRSITGTPAGHWLALCAQATRERRASLAVASEAHARLGIALADAFISCWQAKYQYSTVRPVTVIRKTLDPKWLPLLQTPPFPEYPSGHSVASAAAAHELSVVFGREPFIDHANDSRGLRARGFASYEDAAREAALSRLVGGIHFRPAIENGLVQGECVASTIDSRLRFTSGSK